MLLLSTPWARWPAALAQQPAALAAAEQAAGIELMLGLPEELEPLSLAGEGCLWLGYQSPLQCLIASTAGDAPPEAVLAVWQRRATRFLSLKRNHPQRCRLLNLPLLTPEAIETLLTETGLQAPRAAAPGACAAEAAGADPVLLAWLAERHDLRDLHADLEGCADLLGRQPSFSLPLPQLRRDQLAGLLLEQWRALRQASSEAADLLAEVQRNQEQLEEVLHDRQALQAEARTLFLNSRLQEEINSQRIPRILELVRNSL